MFWLPGYSSWNCLVIKSCPALLLDVDYSLPGSSVCGFSRQEYWSGLPFPSPGDLPDPGLRPESPALVCSFFATEPPGKPSSWNSSVEMLTVFPTEKKVFRNLKV